ncbi:MAG: rhodanese-like domain-containing protein [Planctomycetaceae bacterium]
MTAFLSFCRLFVPGLVAVSAFAAPAIEESPYTKDSLATVQKRLDAKNAVLIDVREKNEWEAGHLRQATLVPLTEIGKKIDDEDFRAKLKKTLPDDKPIYLHCKSGGRCLIATKALRKAFGDEYDFRPLEPGFQELLDAGFKPADDAKK